ncbi:hypothetical protein [Phyllobacterium sp. OV277]|jgi:hypothetical protein|uniref:hypothetical protein n=1 Tax=Phyllobacterium sp. OV277 TaxID=1882772 RepID=UPI0008853F65|nr:hypothetical protein [Phyllobacterium sp. OV277]SDP10066.1 hypothetical protein SAMN05443582_103398 [Phyllobacterium sp. OV277]
MIPEVSFSNMNFHGNDIEGYREQKSQQVWYAVSNPAPFLKRTFCRVDLSAPRLISILERIKAMLAYQADIIDLKAYRQAKADAQRSEQQKPQQLMSYPMVSFAWIAMPVSFVPVVFYSPVAGEAHS